MEQLNFLTEEEMKRMFHGNKSEIAQMEDTRPFLRRLRDHDLILEGKFQDLSRKRNREDGIQEIYDFLDWLEKEKSHHIRKVLDSVFRKSVLDSNPSMQRLYDSLRKEYSVLAEKNASKEHSGEGQNQTNCQKRKDPIDCTGSPPPKKGKEPFPPLKKTPSEKTPSEKTPSEKTPGQKAPSQRASRQRASRQRASRQRASRQKVPGQKVPGQKVPGQMVPGQMVPGQKVPGQKVPGQKVPGQKAAASTPKRAVKSNNDFLQLLVRCGDKQGVLNVNKMDKAEKCIMSDSQWFTPSEFMTFAGKAATNKWKKVIHCRGVKLEKLFEVGLLKQVRFDKKSGETASTSK